jgi:hypothetical protein
MEEADVCGRDWRRSRKGPGMSWLGRMDNLGVCVCGEVQRAFSR